MARLVPIATRLIEPLWTSKVPAPAHDALTPAERRRYVAENPNSYLTVTRSPDDLVAGQSWDADAALTASQAALDRLVRAGAFSPLAEPALYLYRLAKGDHSQTGIVGGVAISDYDDGTIRIHEQIHPARAQHLASHLDFLKVQSSPIALAHRPNQWVTNAIATVTSGLPIVDFTASDGLHQQVWEVTDPEIEATLSGALAGDQLYLIDGHHRASAASSYHHRGGEGGMDSMLCAIFNISEIRNEAFHRRLHGVDLDALLSAIHSRFTEREVDSIEEVLDRLPDEIPLRTRGRWHLVTVPLGGDGASEDPVADLDPVRLQRQVLAPLLGVESTGPSELLTYRHGFGDRADLERVAASSDRAVFVMRPVPLETLMTVADAGFVMPPKSTYFVPKVRSGVFLRPL